MQGISALIDGLVKAGWCQEVVTGQRAAPAGPPVEGWGRRTPGFGNPCEHGRKYRKYRKLGCTGYEGYFRYLRYCPASCNEPLVIEHDDRDSCDDGLSDLPF